jgi:alanine racemase
MVGPSTLDAATVDRLNATMEPSKHVSVRVDLPQVRRNAERIAHDTGVAVIAVVKADAYGLGAKQVAGVVGDLVDAFYVFDAAEAVEADLWRLTGKRTVALHGDWSDPAEYRAARIHPVVWNRERASALRNALPVLAVDTGQQRFAASAEEVADIASAGDCREFMTHAIRIDQVERFKSVVGSVPDQSQPRFLHAAGSALLGEKSAWLSAVRPGLALYHDAMRVSACLVEARDSGGPAGYTGFLSPRFGVIMMGYRNGLKKGPCVVNGVERRVIEVGMQSAFVQLGAGDRVGDEVVLLGPEGPELAAVATTWGTSPQEALVRLGGSGIRAFVK